MNESDPRSDVHYLGSSENKAWKKFQACTGFEPIAHSLGQRRIRLRKQIFQIKYGSRTKTELI